MTQTQDGSTETCKPIWRLLETGHADAFHNMALDEAVLEARRDGRVRPTLRLYGWSPPAVSIGYFQRLDGEVHTQRCEDLGIDVVRRITGGGAVLHDKEVTYSVIASETDDSIPRGMLESYRLICAGIIVGLRSLGIEAGLSGNDIVVGSEKVSGNAQNRKWGVILQHGSIFLDADYGTMFSVLNVASEQVNRGKTCMLRGRMTSMRELGGKDLDFRTVSSHLVKGFEQALGIAFSSEEPTKEEMERAKSLARTKYSTPEWNGRR
ncbi:MAG: lipoate--protein ligase family protein [Candidatus Thermoplasmatota archaeon]|nr:lipoate--protein ligase family protein [Candidatus Thermoplasmatota archaeon]